MASVTLPSLLLDGPLLWRADQLARPDAGAGPARPTGHAALDAELPGGGWPAAGLTELLLAAPGSGELRLLAPALAGPQPLLWIAPPFTPYAPALASQGLASARSMLVAAATAADAAWAAEQALRSGAVGAVLWWADAGVRAPTLRRLHLAAQEGRTPLFALRPSAARPHASPAPLRLALAPAGTATLSVDVFKRRGPPLVAPLMLTLPHPPSRARRTPRPAVVPPHGKAAPSRPAAAVRPAASPQAFCAAPISLPPGAAHVAAAAPASSVTGTATDALVRPAPQPLAA